MRIIKPSRILAFAADHPKAAPSLLRWLQIAKKARWRSLVDTRRDFPHADEVGRQLTPRHHL